MSISEGLTRDLVRGYLRGPARGEGVRSLEVLRLFPPCQNKPARKTHGVHHAT